MNEGGKNESNQRFGGHLALTFLTAITFPSSHLQARLGHQPYTWYQCHRFRAEENEKRA